MVYRRELREKVIGEWRSSRVRQLIIAREDLQMSSRELAVQVSHASMADLADLLRKGEVDEKMSADTGEVAAYL